MVYWGDVHSWGSTSPVSKPLQWHTLPVILNSFFFSIKHYSQSIQGGLAPMGRATAGPGWLWQAGHSDDTAGQSHVSQDRTLWSLGLSSEQGGRGAWGERGAKVREGLRAAGTQRPDQCSPKG